MTEKRWLYFALGVTMVTSIGAVTNQIAPATRTRGVSLDETGIAFSDGTVQTTAAAAVGSRARVGLMRTCNTSLFLSVGSNTDTCDFDTVPAGKILVVEFVSGDLYLPSGQKGLVDFYQLHPSGGFAHHKLINTYQYTSFSLDHYAVSQNIRLYIDELNTLQARFNRNGTTGTAGGHVWITGYLVDKIP